MGATHSRQALTGNMIADELVGRGAAEAEDDADALEVDVPGGVTVTECVAALLDGDAVDEEILVGWSAKGDAGAVLEIPREAADEVRKGAAPFISWLEEAEDSDSSEE